MAAQAELIVKSDVYSRRQEEEAQKLIKYEELKFPGDFPFESVYGLSAEVRDKLVRVRPGSIGQAQRIPGVTPAAVALLLVALKKGRAATPAGRGTAVRIRFRRRPSPGVFHVKQGPGGGASVEGKP